MTAGPRAPAVCTITRRRDFLAAARARRCAASSLVLQARERLPEEPASAPIRVGYTCSRKVGNAVIRNRAKRRLRAAAAAVLPENGRAGWDYVLIGRTEATVSREFAAMIGDLEGALRRVHARPAPR